MFTIIGLMLTGCCWAISYEKEFTQDSYGYHSVNLGAAFHSRHRGRRKRADYQRAAYHRNRGCHTNLRRYFGKCRRCLGIVESFI